MSVNIYTFVTESNRIEGIYRAPTSEEVSATESFICLEELTINDLVQLVAVYQPNAELRSRKGLDVRVGNHIAPRGGNDIQLKLREILSLANRRIHTPHYLHLDYENLHPFTDGNGRSGRALWLWCMRGDAPLGFLHTFYYQTLAENPRRSNPKPTP